MTEKLPPVIREKCGTRKGYLAHSYYKETSCDPCREANSARFRRWYLTAVDAERERFKKNSSTEEFRLRQSERSRARRAKKLGNDHEPYTLEEVIEVWGTDCYICTLSIDFEAPRQVGQEGWERGLHLDHVIPLVYGGPDNIDNVKPTHGKCNLMKSAKGPGWISIDAD